MHANAPYLTLTENSVYAEELNVFILVIMHTDLNLDLSFGFSLYLNPV